MLVIKKYVESIDEEIEGAKDYAEKYVEAKAKGDINKATRYKEMANDELKHAMYLHEWAVECIETISKVFTAPVDMQEKWDKSHKEYVEKVAWIRQMLSM
jgi:uncharacterized coiled-coil DUF342 family protein